MKAFTPTLSSSALRPARRGHPTPGHPEYTFLGFSVLKSFFLLLPGGGPASLAGASHSWRGPDIPGGGHTSIEGLSQNTRDVLHEVMKQDCIC